jgi:hypothetical protein
MKTTFINFETYLKSINEKLEIIFKQTVIESDTNATKLWFIKKKRLNTQKYFQICAQLSDHISQIQLTPKRNDNSSKLINPNAFPEIIINMGLYKCKNSLILTATKLERHIQDLINRLVTKSKTAITFKKDVADLRKLRENKKRPASI